jgi:hypothetical protein
MFRDGKLAGAASNEMNCCAGKVVPTGAVARFKFRIVTMVPARVEKSPVAGDPITALSGVKGASAKFHVIIVGVTVMEPAMLNVPVIGLADRLTHINPPSAAVANRTLRVIC